MTAIAERIVGPVGAPSWRVRFGWAVSDTLTITRRNLLVWMRVPAYLVFTVVQPVIFVLMFRYVFGGAIRVSSAGGYVDFLLPGIIAQTAAFACFGTAIALAQELKKGVIDRLRAMPMARSAVLAGRLVADTLRMTVTILIVLAVGYAVGFRFSNGVVPAIAMVALADLVRRGHRLYLGVHRAGHRRRGIGAGIRADLDLPAHVPVLGVRADRDHAGLAAGVREQPAGHLHHQRHARAGPGRSDRGQPVEEPGLAGGHLHGVRAAVRPGLQAGFLRSRAAGRCRRGGSGSPGGGRPGLRSTGRGRRRGG